MLQKVCFDQKASEVAWFESRGGKNGYCPTTFPLNAQCDGWRMQDMVVGMVISQCMRVWRQQVGGVWLEL